MQPHVTTAALAGLFLCLVAIAASLARLFTTKQKSPDGWLKLEPGSMHWKSSIGSIAFSLVVFWIWLFVGSGKPDAKQEMQIAYWMAVTFALGGSYLAHYITVLKIQNTRWLDRKILRNDRKRQCVQLFDDGFCVIQTKLEKPDRYLFFRWAGSVGRSVYEKR